MAMYSKRDCGYKVGMLLFCLGVACFVTGFATPHWAKFEFCVKALSSSSSTPATQQDWEVEGHTGIWTYCFQTVLLGRSQCQDVSSSSADWMTGVKVVQCTAVGVMGLALGFYFFTNCVARKAAFTRLLEVATGISGLLGAIGAGVYLWKSFTEDDVRNSFERHHDFKLSLSWSFYVNAGGSIIILLATILIAIYNNRIHPKQAPNISIIERVAGPSAPPFETSRAAATVAQGYRSSGTNPYVLSAAMTANTPKLYPILQELDEHAAAE